MVKKAVIVGCDYPGTVSELKGGVNDAYALAELLTRQLGFRRDHICFLVDRDRATTGPERNVERLPTRASILRALEWLTSRSEPGDVLFFSFAGLGTQTTAANSIDEDAMHEAFCPTDFAHEESKQEAQQLGTTPFPYRLVHDCEVQTLLHRAHPMAHLLCVLDCNHSGTMVPVPHKFDGTTHRQVRVRPPRGFLARTRDEKAWKGNDTPARPRFLPALSMAKKFPAAARGLGPWGKQGFAYSFSAARDDQTAVEVALGSRAVDHRGLLTHVFCSSLASLRYNCSYEQLFERMSEQLEKLRQDPGLRFSNQHVQFAFAEGLTPACEKVFGMPSCPQDQELFVSAEAGAPAVTKSALVNAELLKYVERSKERGVS